MCVKFWFLTISNKLFNKVRTTINNDIIWLQFTRQIYSRLLLNGLIFMFLWFFSWINRIGIRCCWLRDSNNDSISSNLHVFWPKIKDVCVKIDFYAFQDKNSFPVFFFKNKSKARNIVEKSFSIDKSIHFQVYPSSFPVSSLFIILKGYFRLEFEIRIQLISAQSASNIYNEFSDLF